MKDGLKYKLNEYEKIKGMSDEKAQEYKSYVQGQKEILQKEIIKESKKLKKIFSVSEYDKNLQIVIDNLIERAAFLHAELTLIENELLNNGVLDYYVQGLQNFLRNNPLNAVYNQYLKSYKETIKLLQGYITGEAKDTKNVGIVSITEALSKFRVQK